MRRAGSHGKSHQRGRCAEQRACKHVCVGVPQILNAEKRADERHQRAGEETRLRGVEPTGNLEHIHSAEEDVQQPGPPVQEQEETRERGHRKKSEERP
jgi:hypothetical protein